MRYQLGMPSVCVAAAIGIFAGGVLADPGDPFPFISTEVAFSELDGGAMDQDGATDGVFTAASLSVGFGGRVIIDVPSAEFDIAGLVWLGPDAYVGPSNGAAPTTGPILSIQAAGSLVMIGNAAVSVHGTERAGAIIVCSSRYVSLWGHATISADGGSMSEPGLGGAVWIQAARSISLNNSSTRISADGATGGLVRLISCYDDEHAISVRGPISARGYVNGGGTIDAVARQAGIQIVSGNGSFDASGATSDGSVSLTAATSVVPAIPPSTPAAVVLENQPSAEPCDACTIELENDCNLNGTDDDVEIANCDGAPSCSDCNFNDRPDVCDIADGTSIDVDPLDGIPDECSEFVDGGCFPPSLSWSCFDNWLLPGELYPDDLSSAPGIHVTLGPNDQVFLDVDVRIPSLVLSDGSRLSVTQSGPVGNLSFSTPAELINRGQILLSNGRTLGDPAGVRPQVTIGPNGLIGKDPAAPGSNAVVSTALLTIEPGACSPNPKDGGALVLDDAMQLDVLGDVVLNDAGVTQCLGRVAGANRGGVAPPPKLSSKGSARMNLDGGLILSRPEELARGMNASRGLDPSRGSLHLGAVVEVEILPSATVLMSGDFDNKSISPDLFDWFGGTLVMRGSDAQTFEVAGADQGSTTAGFALGNSSNFSIGTLQVESSASLVFVNEFANTVGVGDCEEALYVRHLDVGQGAQITVDNCRVYYRTKSAGNVVPNVIGCGALVQLDPPPASEIGADTCFAGTLSNGVGCSLPSDCAAGTTCSLKSRYLEVKPSQSFLGLVDEPLAIKVTIASMPQAPARVGETWWAGPPAPIADPPRPPLAGSRLECTGSPHVQVWDANEIRLWGAVVVPNAVYEIRMCNPTGTVCSDSFSVATGHWGDAVAPFAVAAQANFGDITAIVDRFKESAAGAPTPYADLSGVVQASLPNVPDGIVNLLDVSAAVDAFREFPYPYSVPACQNGSQE